MHGFLVIGLHSLNIVNILPTIRSHPAELQPLLVLLIDILETLLPM